MKAQWVFLNVRKVNHQFMDHGMAGVLLALIRKFIGYAPRDFSQLSQQPLLSIVKACHCLTPIPHFTILNFHIDFGTARRQNLAQW
jgi:hypothetical protein